MFEIKSTSSFNTDRLTEGDDYDYITRTSQNQGILRNTGFVNKKNVNPAGTWSLGLLQMDFFYREKPWYAGQFIIRKTIFLAIPKRSETIPERKRKTNWSWREQTHNPKSIIKKPRKNCIFRGFFVL